MDRLYTLAETLGAALKVRGLVLTLAESCTGGMAAQAITNVPGSSAWFDRGFITYSNQAKVEMLGVNRKTLIQFGAVSIQIADEMAQGALKHSLAHLSASVTGIAGPDGGTAEKPVGTVCFGFAQKNSAKTCIQHFSGTRERIRQQAVVYLLTELIELTATT